MNDTIKAQDKFVKTIRRLVEASPEGSRVREALTNVYSVALSDLADMLAGKNS